MIYGTIYDLLRIHKGSLGGALHLMTSIYNYDDYNGILYILQKPMFLSIWKCIRTLKTENYRDYDLFLLIFSFLFYEHFMNMYDYPHAPLKTG